MFDRIVPQYDLMNRVMTGGRDVAWRQVAVREALRGRDAGRSSVLDVATGTGDLALALKDAGAGKVVALDFSRAMLAAARYKAASRPEKEIGLVEADALSLPFRNGVFDAVTVGFGLRNTPDYERAIQEMARVLRPGGVLVCLETTPLSFPPLQWLFERASASVLPWVGGLLSGDRDAYAYLPASAAVFPDAMALGKMMQRAGLIKVRFLRLGLGTVALHVARRPDTARDRSGVAGRGVPTPRQSQTFDQADDGE
jgi:demethylmenaquinone methyltransferase/2-methoxy-6-polyprenyl-1,4-benzoquinol methylase